MKCGIEIIGAKDEIHHYWFDIQVGKRVDLAADDAYIPKEPTDKLVAEAVNAIGVFQQCAPEDEMWRGQWAEEALGKCLPSAWAKGEITLDDGLSYYITDTIQADNLIITYINSLANYIHRAGYSLLEKSGEYCGCVIMEGADLSSTNKGALKYCQGTLNLEYPRGHILPPGNKVEHRPGAAANHAMVVKFEEDEEGYDTKVHYTESGDDNWRDRQTEVVGFMERMGMKCEYPSDSLAVDCRGVLDDDQILDFALLISQLKDIDLLPYECIPVAFEEVYKQSALLKERHKDDLDTIWNSKWTRAGENARVEDCKWDVAHREAEEYAEREVERRDESRQDSYDNCLQRLIRYRTAARYGDCEGRVVDRCAWLPQFTSTPYFNLARALETADELSDRAEALERAVGDITVWEVVENQHEENRNAAEDIVKKCPPEQALLMAIDTTPLDSIWRLQSFLEDVAMVVGYTGDQVFRYETLPKYVEWANVKKLMAQIRAVDKSINAYQSSTDQDFQGVCELVWASKSDKCGFDPYNHIWEAFFKIKNMESNCDKVKEYWGEYSPDAYDRCKAVVEDADNVARDAAVELVARCAADKALEDTIVRWGESPFAIGWRLEQISRVCAVIGDPCEEEINDLRETYMALPMSAFPLPEYQGGIAGVEW